MKEYLKASSLDEALNLLSKDSQLKVLAGGTDLMVQKHAGSLSDVRFLDINALPSLKNINEKDWGIAIGALTTYRQILNSDLVLAEFPLLAQAARETASVAIQNRGTLGGNIVNASPAGDSLPVLLVYNALLELQTQKEKRNIAYTDFHQGYKKMDLRSGELLTQILLPKGNTWDRSYFKKVGTRKAQSISKVVMAALLKMNGETIEDVRIALGSIAAFPLRCRFLEDFLKGQQLPLLKREELDRLIEQNICPMDDIRSTKEYRLQIVKNLVWDFLKA